jgi:hypothetical protein
VTSAITTVAPNCLASSAMQTSLFMQYRVNEVHDTIEPIHLVDLHAPVKNTNIHVNFIEYIVKIQLLT